jgi:hypothetical protein
VVEHTFNPSTPEDEAGGSRVPGQLEIHSKTLSQKKRVRERERDYSYHNQSLSRGSKDKKKT